MFKIDDKYKTATKRFEITNSSYVLLYADKEPFLFGGKNNDGEFIMASIMEEDDDFTLRFMYLITTEKEYGDLIDRKITYRQVVENAQAVFILDTDVNKVNAISWEVPLPEIPEDCLPTKDTYLPKI